MTFTNLLLIALILSGLWSLWQRALIWGLRGDVGKLTRALEDRDRLAEARSGRTIANPDNQWK